MFIQTLDVVNACLATMGEAPLNTLNDDHSYKAAALNYITEVNRIEQAPGWWFNSSYVELMPDATSGYIYIPQDALAIKPVHKVSPVFGQRGKRLFDPGSNGFVWGRGVWVDVITLVDFCDLPFQAADVVKWGATLRFQRDYDGDTTRYQQIAQDYQRAKSYLMQEDVKNKRPNLLHRKSVRIVEQFIGPQRNFLNQGRLPVYYPGESNG